MKYIDEFRDGERARGDVAGDGGSGAGDGVVTDLGRAEADVVGNGARKQHRLLQHQHRAAANRIEGQLPDVVPVQAYGPLRNVVEAADQAGQGGFP